MNTIALAVVWFRQGATIINPLMRQLYWRNLLVACEKRLCWRCEALLLAGREVLES